MKMKTKKAPLMTRRLLVFMGTMILANVSGHMYFPLLPLYVQELGADIGQVGLFFTMGAVAPLFFQIFGGWLSDSIGRLQAIAIGSVGGVLGFIAYVYAPSWEWLLLATITSAMAGSFVAPSYLAFISEESPEESRGRVYAISQALFMIVGIVGPPIGGFISQYWGFRTMFIVAWILYGSATVIRLFMARNAARARPESSEKPSFALLKKSLGAMIGLITAGGVVTWIFISDGIRDVSFNMSFQLLPLYMQNLIGLSNIEIGWLSSIHAISTMIFLTPAGWLSDRKGERIGIVVGFTLIAGAMALFINSGAFLGFAAVWALFGLGSALIEPAYNSLISKVVPMSLRGTAFGVFSTSIGVISLPAPFIGAMLWERFTPKLPFVIPIIATLLVIPVMWFKFRLPANDQAKEEVQA